MTVTVAGPHSPPGADEPPTGDLSRPLLAAPALVSIGEFPLSLETGWGTTVTIEVMAVFEGTGADPVGAMVVVLPWPYGAVGPAVGKGPGGKTPDG